MLLDYGKTDDDFPVDVPKMWRVRQVIPFIDYNKLVRDAILPPDIFAEKVAKSTFPKWANSQRSAFGLFTETLLVHFAQSHVVKITDIDIAQIAQKDGLVCTTDDLTASEKLWWKFFHFAKASLAAYTPDVVLQSGILQGHPDLYRTDEILDVKTTANFASMRVETVLQLVLYACLSSVSSIGVVLPLTKQVLRYPTASLNLPKLQRLLQQLLNMISLAPVLAFHPRSVVGHHVGRDKNTFKEALMGYYANSHNRPIQMFLGSPQMKHFAKIPPEDITEIHTFITQKQIRYFTHSPYLINLAMPFEMTADGKFIAPWFIEILKHELNVTKRLGGRGVVVHLGAAKELTEQMGLRQMAWAINILLPYIDPSCPLLIETGCGEGTELCGNIYDLLTFIAQFPADKIGICVDTCHVFAAGHSPLLALELLAERTRLIHFNDSAKPKGCHADKHAYYGNGYIGADLLTRCLIFAESRNIPCVFE
jgi:deoxyribonuclease-4